MARARLLQLVVEPVICADLFCSRVTGEGRRTGKGVTALGITRTTCSERRIVGSCAKYPLNEGRVYLMPTALDPEIVDEVREYQVEGRTEGAAFLAWFMVNFFRIDPEEARDSVCDSINDKGIDGILVDDQTGEVVLFQAKYKTDEERSQGDNDLRNFAGASRWFDTPETVDSLVESTASEELKSLIRRCEVQKRLSEGYGVRLVFLSSLPFDSNAEDYIRMQEVLAIPLSAWDCEAINEGFSRFTKSEKIIATHEFDIVPGGYFRQRVSDTIEVVVLPLRAMQVAALQGIEDRSLFARNVRFGIGRTRVNRDIEATISQPEEHSNFVLYHNGITILCDEFELSDDTLRITNYSIVNGCQSLISFYDNRAELSEDLLVLAKVVKVGPRRSRIAEDITYYNNNQNAISMQDLRSNDRIQVGLQNQFKEYFGDKLFYRIKRGEDAPEGATIIDNGLAAQLLLSFYNGEPENAHKKYNLFDQNYSQIFHRNINTEHVYLGFTIFEAVSEAFQSVEDALVRDYKLSRFFLLYVIHLLLQQDDIGKQILANPKVPILQHEEQVLEAVGKLARMMVVEFNYLVENRKEQTEYFDYKSDFKSREEVRKMAADLTKAYERSLVRHPEDSFAEMLTEGGRIPSEAFFR